MSACLLQSRSKLVFDGYAHVTRNMSSDAKKALRKSMKTKLSSLSAEDISDQSQRAQRLILNLPQYKTATRISVYLSMPKAEAQTDLIVHDALKSGKAVFVPYIHRPSVRQGEAKKRSTIEMLRLDSAQEYDHLERDSWGIPSLPIDGLEKRQNAAGGKGLEPREGIDHGLDLVVVPGVAFDAGLMRLGHGAGFYDEYLTRFWGERKRPKPFLAGLCLAEQVLPQGNEVPTSEHDWRMDAVAVGDGRLVTLKGL